MKLYDTASKKYRRFSANKLVNIYVCGITPYDSAHLGHIFTFMNYDLLVRRLEDLGHKVQMVRNITDVDDPLFERARELNINYLELANQQIDSFHRLMKQLNFKPLYAEPRVSDYIDEIAEAVSKLIDQGFGYYINKDVYFDTTKHPDFSKFSGLSERLMLGLAKIRGGDPDNKAKRHPLDFILWKNVSPSSNEASWPASIGNGRPGWHIECSVMSSNLLSVPFDIHGGGSDLIFPHHSAEIAQSYGLHQPQLARYWVHVYPLFSDGEKMSKSLGNLVFVEDLLKTARPAAIRLALMHYHHRIGGEWQSKLLKSADQMLDSVIEVKKTADLQSAKQLLGNIRTALDDDINTLEVIDALKLFIKLNSKHSAINHQAEALVDQTLDLLGLNLI